MDIKEYKRKVDDVTKYTDNVLNPLYGYSLYDAVCGIPEHLSHSEKTVFIMNSGSFEGIIKMDIEELKQRIISLFKYGNPTEAQWRAMAESILDAFENDDRVPTIIKDAINYKNKENENAL